GHERPGGAEELLDVRVERLVVADDLELDEVGLEGLAGELGGEDGLAGGVAAGRVRQEVVAARAEEPEEALAAGVPEVEAADRDRGERGAGGLQRVEHHLRARVPARPDEHAARERERPQPQHVLRRPYPVRIHGPSPDVLSLPAWR